MARLNPALLTPGNLKATAPATFRAKFVTTKGEFVIEVTRAWAPVGADRFYNLVKNGFYNQAAFFRVLQTPRPFMAQFGISAFPAVSRAWQSANIKDDAVNQSNTRGMVTYAKSGAPNSRTTQIFINYGDNSFLDASGFAPFGKVIEGMEVVDKLHSGYGEGAPGGAGPSQGRLQEEGKAYLDKMFPLLDKTVTATIVPAVAPAKPAGVKPPGTATPKPAVKPAATKPAPAKPAAAKPTAKQ
ncbi:MAG: peptidylprolyl isomerase [Bryobacteraceae bacterium]